MSMFYTSCRSISIMYKYAPKLTILKLCQVILSSCISAASIFFFQKVVDSASLLIFYNGELSYLIIWIALLLVSMFFGALSTDCLNGILMISLKRKLDEGILPDILEKFKRLEYAYFENVDFQDTLNLMSKDPVDNILQLFLTTTDTIGYTIRLSATTILFAQSTWWIAVGFAALFMPLTWLNFKTADMMNEIYNNQSIKDRKLHYYGELLSTKSALFELKLFHAMPYISKKWNSLSKEVLNERIHTKVLAHNYLLAGILLTYVWLIFITQTSQFEKSYEP